MKYSVAWDPDAIEALQRIYDASPDQEGLVNTVTRIGIELSLNPIQAGESREHGKRILFKYPVVVVFRIVDRLQSVSILEIRPMRQ